MLTYGEAGLIALIVVVVVSAVWRSSNMQRWQIKREIKKQRTRYKEQEEADNERHDTALHAISAHVHTIGKHLSSQGEEQSRQDSKRAARETRTLILIGMTAFFAFGSDVIFYDQLYEMKNDGRAWIGPLNATVVASFQISDPITLDVSYSNTGKTPATNFGVSTTSGIFSADEWNNGKAASEIFDYEKRCMAYQNQNSHGVVFPTTGFSAYNDQIESFDKEKPPADTSRVAVSQNFIDGKDVLALMGCFIYVSNREMHHTSFCFWFQNRKTKPEHMSICTVGDDAD